MREIRSVVRSVQIDVMDGTYTDTMSWPYVGAEGNSFLAEQHEDAGLPYWRELDIEVDLMVREPERHIPRWALMGATRAIIHVESTNALKDAVSLAKEHRMEVALALRPATDVSILAPFVDSVVFVQCMGNNRIGRHGVSLDEHVYTKVREMKQQWPTLLVGVDIGVSLETVPLLYASGVRRFATGSAVFEGGEPVRALARLNEAVHACERGA